MSVRVRHDQRAVWKVAHSRLREMCKNNPSRSYRFLLEALISMALHKDGNGSIRRRVRGKEGTVKSQADPRLIMPNNVALRLQKEAKQSFLHVRPTNEECAKEWGPIRMRQDIREGVLRMDNCSFFLKRPKPICFNFRGTPVVPRITPNRFISLN